MDIIDVDSERISPRADSVSAFVEMRADSGAGGHGWAAGKLLLIDKQPEGYGVTHWRSCEGMMNSIRRSGLLGMGLKCACGE